MLFLCFCFWIGVIIYVYSHYNPQRNHHGHNVGGPANSSREFGPVIYYANDTHNNYDREYRFHYRYVGDGWRAYILRTPNINNRAGGAHVHMLSDRGACYICWDRTVSTLHDMQVISKAWADNYQEYLSTGRTF